MIFDYTDGIHAKSKSVQQRRGRMEHKRVAVKYRKRACEERQVYRLGQVAMVIAL